MDKILKSFSLQAKDFTPEGKVTAVFATLGIVDKDGDVTLPGFFGKQKVAVVPVHNWNHVPIGKATIREEGNQAVADIQMNLAISDGRDWFEAMKFDLAQGSPIMEWSYGFKILDGGASRGDFSGRQVRFLQPLADGSPGSRVYEVSPVLVGAGEGTRTAAVKDAEGEGKVAIRGHNTAVVDVAWDAGANINRALDDQSAAYYARIFAWRNTAGDPTNKSSYKFPHHMVGQDGAPGAANVKALVSAIGALNGARGGADIPAGDRQTVWSHLAGHLRDAGVEPPPLKSEEPEEGKRFCEEAQAALDAAQALVERAKALADLRAKQNRRLSAENLGRLAELSAALAKAAAECATVAKAGPDPGARQEWARYVRMTSGLKP